MAKFTEHGIRLSSMCPTFLNSNSTSHTWPFSAVAELVDNAADPGVFAKQIWIDVIEEADQLCLTFTDNGSGMTPNKLHKMLSFGFTEKGNARTSVQAVGVYGNGFKSGSMRLGRDALIFTKSGGCQSVGMLSQTYLEDIKAQSVIVPIVPFNQQTHSLVKTDDSEASLAAILQHSIVSSQEQIQAHFDSIPSKKGTKILLWNLRRAKDEKPEIDFDTDPSDFRLPEIQIEELKNNLKSSGLLRTEQNIPDMHYSLKAYLSILYLKPRIQVILRGKKISTKMLTQRLTHVEYDVYRPHFSKDKVKVTFGMNVKNRDNYGIMMYHKNRLIKAYEKAGCQLRTFGQRTGVGVIGIIECDFLKPAHNKQDFEYTKEYRVTLSALGLKLNDYWKEVMERKARQREFEAVDKEDDTGQHKGNAQDGPKWVQCTECLKWRSVPASHYKAIPENWSCSQNPNPRYRSCSSQEETDDNEGLLTASYHKKHSKRDYTRSKKRQSKREFGDFSGPTQSTNLPSERPGHLSIQDPCSGEEHTKEQDVLTDLSAEEEEVTSPTTSERGSVINNTVNMANKQTQYGPEQFKLTRETNKDQEEARLKSDEAVDTASNKRKWDALLHHAEKKARLENNQNVSNYKQDNLILETLTKEKTLQIITGLTDKPVDSSLPVTEEDSREARMKRLDEMEKETQILRQLLGLEIIKKTQGTMTTIIETPKEEENTIATREIGCQAEITENSSSSGSITSVSKLHEEVIQGSIALCGLKEPEPNKSKKQRTENNNRSSALEEHTSRLSQDKLYGIRNNVVALLTALLPQLDLTGISLDSTDIDNILQQIIEVNALKL